MHSDKQSVDDLLRDIGIKLNRYYQVENILYIDMNPWDIGIKLNRYYQVENIKYIDMNPWDIGI